MANALKLFRNGAVGFIDWLDVPCLSSVFMLIYKPLRQVALPDITLLYTKSPGPTLLCSGGTWTDVYNTSASSRRRIDPLQCWLLQSTMR